jgi:hypothetical protein
MDNRGGYPTGNGRDACAIAHPLALALCFLQAVSPFVAFARGVRWAAAN